MRMWIALARERLFRSRDRLDPIDRMLRRLVWMALYGLVVAAAGVGVLRLLGDAPGVAVARGAATVLVVVSMITMMVATVGWSVYAWRRPRAGAGPVEPHQFNARLNRVGPDEPNRLVGGATTCTG